MKIDYVRFLVEHGIKIKEVRKNQWIEINCPFCKDDNFHGALNIQSGGYHCWKCGNHSRNELISMITGAVEPHDIWHELQAYATDNINYTYKEKKPKENIEERIYKVEQVKNGISVPGSSNLSSQMRLYLKNRGFNSDYIQKHYNIKDGGKVGKYAWRVMIPFNLNNRTVAFQGRHIINDTTYPRYLASKADESLVNVKDMVYNLEHCNTNKAIVVEGVFDCWKVGDGCCALCGITVQDSQLRMLANNFNEIWILFDPEPRAQEQAIYCCKKLIALGVKSHVITYNDSKSSDPGDMTEDEIIQIRKFVFNDCKKHLPQFFKEEK